MLIKGFLHVFFFDRWIYDVEHRLLDQVVACTFLGGSSTPVE